ncbi:MAG: D-alanine--D-alanine ligase [Syntrophomonadaceae bacterium]|jgi:D-alanine-D-alanine ligase|nr:D-alanine--D-alanine ligase [Syntrophomonadaceae bacterium]
MRIAILMGGKSREREVSLKSGRAVTEALLRKGYEAIPVDAAEDVAAKLKEIDPELVFIALHGRYGEDGAIQGLLEVMGLPYTGSGVACSAVCMDKVLTKKLLMYEGIPTAPFMVIDKDAYFKNSKAVQAQIINELGLPVVIKPATQGSSIGTSIVREEEALDGAVVEALLMSDQALAEKFIAGVEITASVLGNNEPVVLPLIEIEAAKGVYDYEAKYTPGGSVHIIPARISSEAADRVKSIAKSIYRSLNCRGFSRIDFIIDSSEQPWVLEVNTIPGMTGLSLFPDAASHYGMGYDDLVEEIVKLAADFWGVRG